jgi:hypothetical protein
MPLQCSHHLPFVAIVRRNEVRTYKQENDVIVVNVPVDRLIYLLTRNDAPVVPGFNDALALEHGELLLELVAELLVCMAVGKENAGQGQTPQGAGQTSVGWSLSKSTWGRSIPSQSEL